jgi:hypothetical protein
MIVRTAHHFGDQPGRDHRPPDTAVASVDSRTLPGAVETSQSA